MPEPSGERGLAPRRRRPANDAILIIRIPEDLREEAARKASAAGISLSEAVRHALIAWLARD